MHDDTWYRYKAKLKSGREHEFGTALGGLIAPGARERVEYDWKHYVRRTSKRRSRAQIEGTGTSDRHEYPHGSSGFVWWGRPMWDNMGYFAVSIRDHPSGRGPDSSRAN